MWNRFQIGLIKVLDLLVVVLCKLLEAAFCLGILWGWIKVTMYLWPEAKWLHLAFAAILAVDYALIVSRIKPGGMTTWFKRGN
jgi:hypothetical protein